MYCERIIEVIKHNVVHYMLPLFLLSLSLSLSLLFPIIVLFYIFNMVSEIFQHISGDSAYDLHLYVKAFLGCMFPFIYLIIYKTLFIEKEFESYKSLLLLH